MARSTDELETPGALVAVDRTHATIARAARAATAPDYRGITLYPGHIRSAVERQSARLEELPAGLEVWVRPISEAHGILDLSPSGWRPGVGGRLRIVPNPVCVSANLQARLYGVRAGEVVEVWEVEGRRWLPASR